MKKRLVSAQFVVVIFVGVWLANKYDLENSSVKNDIGEKV